MVEHEVIEGKATLLMLLLFFIYFIVVGYYEFKDVGAFGQPILLASTILGLYEYGTYTERRIGSFVFALLLISGYCLQFFAYLQFKNKYFYTPYGILFFILTCGVCLKIYGAWREHRRVEKLFKFIDLLVSFVFCGLFFYGNFLKANLSSDSMIIRSSGVVLGIFVSIIFVARRELSFSQIYTDKTK